MDVENTVGVLRVVRTKSFEILELVEIDIYIYIYISETCGTATIFCLQ